MDTIILNHEKHQRPHPRPTMQCDGCRGTLILCWGDIRKPYWRHKSENGTGCAGGGESAVHKLAKKLLIDYLNQGNTVVVENVCERCDRSTRDEISKTSKSISSFVEEFRYEQQDLFVFDIAGLDIGNNPIYVIEIEHTHETNRSPETFALPWVEFEAIDVLNQLDRHQLGQSINLRNTNIKVPCDESCRRLIRNFARTLGYLIATSGYDTLSRQLVDEAIRGSYIMYEESWKLSEDNNIPKPTYDQWQRFIKLQRCIRCEKPCKTKYRRPFCLDCWKQTKEADGSVEKRQVSNRKYELRKAFAWLNRVPGNWGSGLTCHFCNRSEITAPYVHMYTWWFGDKKRCCTDCLEDQARKRGIIIGGQ